MRRLLFLLLLGGCGVELEHGLDEHQANQIASVLSEAGIGADKVPEEGQNALYKVVVPRSEAAHAFSILEANELPRRRQKGLAETFPESTLLPSSVEEEARYAAGLSADLERSLEAIPNVVGARVHLALPSQDALLAISNTHERPTASVLLTTRGQPPLSELDIRRLVAGGVRNLQPTDVSVVLAATAAPTPTTVAWSRLGPIRVAPESRPVLAALAGSGFGLLFVLAILLIVTLWRLQLLRRRLHAGESTA